MKWLQFTAIETEQPAATYRLVAGIDEDLIVETLSGFMDHQATPTHLESYLFALSIIRQKAAQLIEAHTGGQKPFRLTEFVAQDTHLPAGEPAFSKGGLSLWITP